MQAYIIVLRQETSKSGEEKVDNWQVKMAFHCTKSNLLAGKAMLYSKQVPTTKLDFSLEKNKVENEWHLNEPWSFGKIFIVIGNLKMNKTNIKG